MMHPPPAPLRVHDDRLPPPAAMQPLPPPMMMHAAGPEPTRGPYRLGPEPGGLHHQQGPPSPTLPLRGRYQVLPPPLRDPIGPGRDGFGPGPGAKQGPGRFAQEADPFRDPLPPPRPPPEVLQPRAPYRVWEEQPRRGSPPPPPHMMGMRGAQPPPPLMQQPPMQPYGERMHLRGPLRPDEVVGPVGPPMQQPGPRGLPHAPYRAGPGDFGRPALGGRGPYMV